MYSRRIVKNPSSRSALVKALRVETKRLKIDLLRLFIKAYPSKTQTTYTIWLPIYASVYVCRRPYSSSRDRDRDGPGRARERDQQQPYVYVCRAAKIGKVSAPIVTAPALIVAVVGAHLKLRDTI
uniref:Uncharacterized protein n=1 Tax=Trichogramma kaykai TaxID=54128 RepID=A0ABD2WBM9_9HYME